MEKTNRFMHHPMSRKETVSKSPVSTSNRGDDNRGDDRGGEAATMFASAARVNATGPLLLVPATVDGARGVQLSLDASSALSYCRVKASTRGNARARLTTNDSVRLVWHIGAPAAYVWYWRGEQRGQSHVFARCNHRAHDAAASRQRVPHQQRVL